MKRLFFGIVVAGIYYLSFPPSMETSSRFSLIPPGIQSEMHLPDAGWWQSLSCLRHNTRLEKLCQAGPVRDQAFNMLRAEHAGSLNLGQICDVFDYFQQYWSYLPDPYQEEYFDNAQFALAKMKGDCDDEAIAMATVLRALGAGTRLVGAYKPDGGHAFVQVYIGQDNHVPSVVSYLQRRYAGVTSYTILKDDWGNCWLNLDPIYDYPGGQLYAAEQGFIFVLGQPKLCLPW